MHCGCAFSLLRIFSTTSVCTLAVSPGQPSLISDDADVVALIGTSKDLAKQINQKEVHWGVCHASVGLFAFKS
jgi:hypothetical protein